MLRTVVGKVMWVGRATVFMVGLAVIVALVFGVASTVSAHGGVDTKLFHLGHFNSASSPTSLVSTLADAAKSALIVNNKSGGAALDLRVGNATTPADEVPPMKVNSSTKVTNLNADKVDGTDSTGFLGKTEKAADSDKLDGKDSSEFQQVPTSTQHFTIPGSAMVDEDSQNRNSVYVGTQWCTTTGGDRGFAPIHLPQGAVMTALKADYVDDPGITSSNGFLAVTRMPLVGSDGFYDDVLTAVWPNTQAPGELASGSDTTPTTGATIDNTKYAYTVFASPASGTAICGVDISYTVVPGFTGAALSTDARTGAGPSTLP